MKTAKEYSDTAKREVSVDVDALLAATSDNDDEIWKISVFGKIRNPETY